jgi:uncharacterized protein YabN with tetrapyrrole methylase and pyrophosphatase domain
MPNLIDVFPDAKTLLALEPEELGDVLFEVIHGRIQTVEGWFGLLAIVRSLDAHNTPEMASPMHPPSEV